MSIGKTNGVNFSPLVLPNLQLWLRSDLGITLNGSNVSAWADQSGNGRDFTQAVAIAQPGYNASSGANGTPALTFNGTTQNLDGAGFGFNTTGALIIVFKNDAASVVGTANAIFEASNGSNAIDFEVINFAGYTVYNFGLNYSSGNLVGISDAFQNSLFEAWIVNNTGSAVGLPGAHTADVSGATKTPIASGAPVSPASFGNKSGIGYRIDILGGFWQGRICEIIVTSSNLSAGDQTLVRAYLNLRYGL